MKFFRLPSILCALCVVLVNAFGLDRNAFTFTKYNLDVRIEPEQQRLGVRGTITLRNDSPVPQKYAVLQISSSLDWKSIQVAGKPVQVLSQPYTSDIDHTGDLSEAIVTLPQEIPSTGTIDLDIGYEGVIPLDVTRLTRIGTPEDVAKHNDWDQISPSFTAVRGLGYVVWYPVAMVSANLSEGNDLFAAVGRWKAREKLAQMEVAFRYSKSGSEAPPTLFCNGKEEKQGYQEIGRTQLLTANCSFASLGLTIPTFAIANYEILEASAARVYYSFASKPAAEIDAEAAQKVLPLVKEWFGEPRQKVQVLQLPDPQAAPFESGIMLLTSFSNDPNIAEITLVHELTHAAFPSTRPWIYEGLAHLAQALYREQQAGRQAALDYLGLHRATVVDAEKAATEAQKQNSGVKQSLITTTDEEFYRSKAMYVWWMLRDLVGAPALKKALAAYHPDDDKQPSYMQKLIEAQTKRDLEWFFDDWVYRDRGLPDFRVASAYSRPMLGGGYMVTVTVENLGEVSAEVPVTLRSDGGAVTKRLVVKGKDKASIRIEVPSLPQEAVVNDSSVPESDMTNNTFKIETTNK